MGCRSCRADDDDGYGSPRPRRPRRRVALHAAATALLWAAQEFHAASAALVCQPEVVGSGVPYGEGCPVPIDNPSDCSDAAAQLPEVPDEDAPAIEQSAEDRPDGCWWQEGTPWGQSSLLFFNVLPAGADPVRCTEGRPCLCCKPSVETSTTLTATETTTRTIAQGLVPVEGCDAQFVSTGFPLGETCPRPVASKEVCSQVASGMGVLQEQFVQDRPQGCWWQEGTPSGGQSRGLYFNVPPSSSARVACSEAHKCICCATTTTTTTRSCSPADVATGLPGSGACASPLTSLEECDSVGRNLPQLTGVSAEAQEEEDRPAGCWWQGGDTPLLYFNTPPAGSADVACSESWKCICCGGTTTTTTYTGECQPMLVADGVPHGQTCQQPMQTAEECSNAAGVEPQLNAGLAPAILQSESDRPKGCWWQRGEGEGLYFNSPPAGSAPVECTPDRRCVCCGEPDISTTTTTTELCIPGFVETGLPGEGGGDCLRLVKSAEECTAAGNTLEVSAGDGAVEQVEVGRPEGCWVQVGDPSIGNPTALYFNSPAEDSDQECSATRKCICCMHTTTTTTLTSTSLTSTSTTTTSTLTASTTSLSSTTTRSSTTTLSSTTTRSSTTTLSSTTTSSSTTSSSTTSSSSSSTTSLSTTSSTVTASTTTVSGTTTSTTTSRTSTTSMTTTSTTTTSTGTTTLTSFTTTTTTSLTSLTSTGTTTLTTFTTTSTTSLTSLTSTGTTTLTSSTTTITSSLTSVTSTGTTTLTSATTTITSSLTSATSTGTTTLTSSTTTITSSLTSVTSTGTTSLTSATTTITSSLTSATSTGTTTTASTTTTTTMSRSSTSTLTGSSTTSTATDTTLTATATATTNTSTSTATTETTTFTSATRTTSTDTTSTATRTTSTATTLTTTTTTVPPVMLALADEEETIASMGSIFVASALAGSVLCLGLLALLVHLVRSNLSSKLPEIEPDTVPDRVAVGVEVATPNSAGGGRGGGRSRSGSRGGVEWDEQIVQAEDIHLTANSAAPPLPTTSVISPSSSPMREVATERVFSMLDLTGIGFVASNEMKLFAEFMGFRGSDVDWTQEWLEMCNYLGCDPVLGVDLRSFSRLVNDSSSQGCFCSNVDLRAFREDASSAERLGRSTTSLSSLASIHNNGGGLTGGVPGAFVGSVNDFAAAVASSSRNPPASSPSFLATSTASSLASSPPFGTPSGAGFDDSPVTASTVSPAPRRGARSASPAGERSRRQRAPPPQRPPVGTMPRSVPAPACSDTAANLAAAASVHVYGEEVEGDGDADFRL